MLKKNIIFVSIFILLSFAGSATVVPKGSPQVYLEKSLDEVLSLKFEPEEAYKINGNNYYYKIISEVYIEYEGDGYVILDDNGNLYRCKAIWGDKYSLRNNSSYNKNQKYEIRYDFISWEKPSPQGRKNKDTRRIGQITLERIENLLTYAEDYRIREEAKKKAEKEKQEKEAAEAEAKYKKVLASRNVTEIMRFSGREDARLEAAKILTRNNNIKVEEILPTGKFPNFDGSKIYYMKTSCVGTQYDNGKLVIEAGGGFLLFQNVSLQCVVWQRELDGFWHGEALLKYVGLTKGYWIGRSFYRGIAVREIHTFNVLWQEPIRSTIWGM